jgi:arsenite-transporting ATPase
VDCAPTGASLRMFSLPDVLQYYMNKIFPIERQLHKVFRPIGKHILGIPLPKDEVYGSLKDLYEHIKIIRDALVNPKITSIRLVVNPEGMVIKEAQRAYTYLNLFNFSTDAVIVNKLLPRELMNEDYFNVYKEIQNKHLLEIKHQFEPLPIFYVNQIFNKEVVGEDILIELAKDLFKDKDPTSLFYTKKPFDIIKKDGKYIMSINLPFTDKEDLEVLADRDEVTIRLKNYKRNIFLPKRLTSLRLESAHFEGGKLRLSFGEREVMNE